MTFLIECDASGAVLRATGHVRSVGARVYGLSGIAPDDIDGLIAAHTTHGERLSAHLIGQYSAAVAGSGSALLIQSSLGLGRAFWHQSAERIVLGSDLLAVARAAGVPDVDPDYFARLMRFAPVADRTPFASIRQLSDGATLSLRDGSIAQHRPWEPGADLPAEGDPLARLDQLLDDAIGGLTPENAPCFADISGGTDSSLVAAAAIRAGRRIHGLTHVSPRGMKGTDAQHATWVAERLGVPLEQVDSDAIGMATTLSILPDKPGVGRYQKIARHVAGLVRESGATRYVTGVGGDVVFDYRGLTPAFLADPLVRLRPFSAWRLAARYARARGGHRSASHYLRYVGVPVAVAHFRGQRLSDVLDLPLPDWLAPMHTAAHLPLRASRVRRPSARYLWETLYNLTADENTQPLHEAQAPVVHPLLHRPLVAFLLALPPEIRRGMDGDRALQRAMLTRLGLPEIAAREDKGSAQKLREVHLAEAGDFLESLAEGELVQRGWVRAEAWHRAIDQTAVGANPHPAFFSTAVECELWLRRLREDPGLQGANASPDT